MNSSESYWTLEDGEIHLIITKGSKGLTWESFLKGHTKNDAFTASEVQKSMMLERFQEEVHPRGKGRGGRVPRTCPDIPSRVTSLARRRPDPTLPPPFAPSHPQNPGFDFSGAEFNGAVPDPKTFMGGVGYNNPHH